MDNILVVGDLHGDWGCLNALINTKRPSIVLQCGDFGHWPALEVSKPVLYGMQKSWKLQGVKSKDTKVYWCDGNHEDHWHLRDNTVDYPGVKYMPRGSVLTLPDGRVVMFMGGAESVDKDQRRLGFDWFPEEVISLSDLDRAMEYKGKVDIIISHTCPREFIVGTKTSGKISDPSRHALSYLLEHFKPSQWFFGHWHKSQHGRHNDTVWQALDYPGHRGKWWNKV